MTRKLKIISLWFAEIIVALVTISLKLLWLDNLIPKICAFAGRKMSIRLGSGLGYNKLFKQLEMSLTSEAMNDIKNSKSKQEATKKFYKFIMDVSGIDAYSGKTFKVETNITIYKLITNSRYNRNKDRILIDEEDRYKAIQPVEKLALIHPRTFYKNVVSRNWFAFLKFIFRVETICILKIEVI